MNKVVAFSESLTQQDILENLSSLIGRGEFTTADGEVHFAKNISVNGNQNILKVELSDGSIVDIIVKIK